MPLLFDGTNDAVNHGDIAILDSGLTALTVSFWLKYLAPALSDQIMSKGNNGSTGFSIRNSNPSGSMIFGVAGDRRYALPDAAWHHWAMVYDGSQGTALDRIQVYKDGVLATQTSNSGTIAAAIPDGTTNLMNVGGVSVFANLSVAHLIIVNAIYSAAQVEQQMYSRRPVVTAGIILWSPYDDGTTAADYSGSGNHGTIAGEASQDPAGPGISYGAEPLVM